MEKEPKQLKQLVRILNTDIPGSTPIQHGLTKIRGIGPNLAHAFCIRMNINPSKPTNTFSDVEIKKLEAQLKEMNIDTWMLNRQHDYDTGNDRHLLTTDIKLVKDFDVKRLQKIRSRRGIRHAAGLPVRGQRTKAHFRHGRAVGVASKGKVGGKT